MNVETMAFHMCDKYQNITKITGLFSFEVVFPAFLKKTKDITFAITGVLRLFPLSVLPPLPLRNRYFLCAQLLL